MKYVGGPLDGQEIVTNADNLRTLYIADETDTDYPPRALQYALARTKGGEQIRKYVGVKINKPEVKEAPKLGPEIPRMRFK